MSINWYPGHMARTRRLMQDDLKNIDVVCEIADARIPRSSRNPDLDRLARGKRRLLVLNRADQAEPSKTERWVAYYRSQGLAVIVTDSQKGSFLPAFTSAMRTLCDDLIRRNEEKGQIGKTIRLMIVGVPNVGKSSFINRLLGRKSAVAEDRPGVTRRNQWYTLPGGFDFMDTPGMLWPKIEDDETGFRLAFTGTIRDEILDLEDLACRLLALLEKEAPGALEARYGVAPNGREPFDALCALGKKRGFIVSGGEVNTDRMARVLLDEFRSGKLGRITLESPLEENGHVSV